MRHLPLAILLLAHALAPPSTAAADHQLRPLKGTRTDIAALLLTGGESGTLRATGLALSPCLERTEPGAEAAARPSFVGIEVEGRSLLDAVASRDESDVPESVRVELYVYVMTKGGEIVDSRSLWTRLPLAEIADHFQDGGVLLIERLELPPGEYQLRTLVREPRSQQFALRILGLTVADGETRTPSISPPMFSQDKTGWIVAAGNGSSTDFPSSLPVLGTELPRAFALQGCHLQKSDIEIRLLTRERQPVPNVQVELQHAEDSRPGKKVRGSIAVGTAPAGLYHLEVTATGEAGASTQTLPVFVAEVDSVVSWTALGALSRSPAPVEEPPDVDSGGSARVKSIEGGYRRALDLLAAGRLDDATKSLARLEQRVIESHENPRKATKRLTEAQNRVTARILRQSPEGLLPLLVLHLELQDRYVGAETISSHLLHATRQRIRSLAQVYATDARQEMAPKLAAAALAELAKALERSGFLTSALITLREALALDQSNADVLLDLAYQYEHHRFRAEALDLLARLLELDPDSDEGRLRYAILLRHQERDGESIALFRQLVDDATTDWVVAIAYQELGHHLLRRESLAEAIELLEKGVRRLPTNGRLRIQLSYALDRTGRRKEARAIVSGLSASSARATPRLYYRVPDRRESGRSGSDLIRHATARYPILAAALRKTPS